MTIKISSDIVKPLTENINSASKECLRTTVHSHADYNDKLELTAKNIYTHTSIVVFNFMISACT